MGTFIWKLNGGLINIDHIATTSDENRDGLCKAYGANGEYLGEISGREIDYFYGKIIPSRGEQAAVIGYYPGSNARPSADDIFVDECDVIGWRLNGPDGDADPLLRWIPTSGSLIIVKQLNGIWRGPESTFADVDEAKECLLRREQHSWDEVEKKRTQHAKPTGSSGEEA